MKLLQLPDESQLAERTFGFTDDFLFYVDAQRFTKTCTGVGATIAAGSLQGGSVVVTTGATGNNSSLLRTTNSPFKFTANQPLEFLCVAQYAEASTNQMNAFIGLMSGADLNTMVDSNAGPKTSFSGAGFHKKGGETTWSIIVSLGSTQTSVQLTAANSLDKVLKTAGGSSQQVFKIEYIPRSSTTAKIRFFIDGVLVYKIADYTITSAAAMPAVVYAKAGTTASEVINVDLLRCHQGRIPIAG